MTRAHAMAWICGWAAGQGLQVALGMVTLRQGALSAAAVTVTTLLVSWAASRRASKPIPKVTDTLWWKARGR